MIVPLRRQYMSIHSITAHRTVPSHLQKIIMQPMTTNRRSVRLKHRNSAIVAEDEFLANKKNVGVKYFAPFRGGPLHLIDVNGIEDESISQSSTQEEFISMGME